MNKKKQTIEISFIILVSILFFIYNKQIIYTINYNLNNFFKYSFAPIFLSMTYSYLLIYFNFPYYLNRIIKNQYLCFFLLSLIMGFPNNIMMMKEYNIEIKDMENLICFTNMNSIFYLISISKLIMNNYYWIVILVYYLLYFIVCLIFMRLNKKKMTIVKNTSDSFIVFINKKIPIMITTIFSMITIILLFDTFSFFLTSNAIITVVLKGFLEFSSGLNYLIKMPISAIKKGLIELLILLNGSLSIHLQMSFLLKDYKINYKKFYIVTIVLKSLTTF